MPASLCVACTQHNGCSNFSKGKIMSTFRGRLLIGAVAIGLGAGSVAALAGKPDCGPMGGGMAYGDHGPGGERMKERMEKHAAELHDKLKLNATQEGAWKTYIGKIMPAKMPQRPDRAEMARLTAPERMEKMQGLMKDREKQMEERVAATKEFYAVLTPEQRKTFDEQFPVGPNRHGRRG
jgi:periplasmic protein CpxP/Spy